MFDLEQAIADWRQQMLAAGIKTPVPLEELEIHLREEIERQMQSGTNEQRAFEMAALQIGQADVLKTEFVKANGLLGLIGQDKQTRINRIFGALWLGCFSLGLLTTLRAFSSAFFSIFRNSENFSLAPGFLIAVLLSYIYARGIGGSIALFRGEDHGRRLIRMFAFLGVILCIDQIVAFRSFSVMAGILTIFILASIWFLRPPKKETPKPAEN